MAKLYGTASIKHPPHVAPLQGTTRGGGRHLLTFGFGLALAVLVTLAVAGLGFRLGLWHFRTGFAILKVAAYGGLAATLVTLIAIAYALKTKRGLGLMAMLLAWTMAITAVAVPGYWKRMAERLPRIHDISTDLDTPPRFVAIPPLRQGTDNPVEYGGEKVAAAQRQAYPDLRPMVLDIPSDQAFAKALTAAQRLHWQIVVQAPAEGRIEATDTTFWFGFKDDIVIRVTAQGNRSRVDVRSLSRVGVSDVGTNARRVRAYLAMLATLAS